MVGFFYLFSITGSALSEYSWKEFTYGSSMIVIGIWEQFKQLIPYFTILIIWKIFSDMPVHSLFTVSAIAFWKKCFISVMVVRAQHTLTLFAKFQHLTQVILVFDSVLMCMGMMLMGHIVSGIVTNELMNPIFQTISFSKGRLWFPRIYRILEKMCILLTESIKQSKSIYIHTHIYVYSCHKPSLNT